MKPSKVPTPAPVATPPAPRGPRYRYFTNPPAMVLLKLGDIASQIPPASRASLFDADRVVELPATDLFAGPVPRLSLTRLAELAPDCVLKPAQDTKIKLPAARLALSYKMGETAELIEEPLPPFTPEPVEPVFSEPPAPPEARFAPEPPPFIPQVEANPVAEPPAAATPAVAPAPTAIPVPAPVILPPPRPPAAHKSMTAKVSDPDRPPAPVRLTPQPAPAPVARAVEPPAPVPPPPAAKEEAPAAPIIPPAPTAPLSPPPAPRVSPLPQERKARPFFPMFRRKEQPEASATPPPPPVAPEVPKNTGRIEIPRPKSTFLPRPKPAGLSPIATPAPEAPSPVAVPRHVAVATPVPAPAPIIPPPPVEPPAPTVEPEPELIAEPAPTASLPEPPAPLLQTEAVFVETEHLPRESNTPPPEIPEQDSLQAVFMTEEFLTVERVVELCGGLPGVTSCVLSRGAGVVASHHVPENFDLVSLSAHALEMLFAMRASAAKMGVGAVPAVTIHSAKGPITFFQQEDLCLLVLHKDRGFIPGVREKLQRVIEELSRANLPLPVGQPRPAIKPF